MRVERVGVVGAGTMGASIAELFAFNGIEVLLKDLDRPLVERGLAKVRQLASGLADFHEGRAGKELERLRGLGLELTEPQQEKVRAALRPKFPRARVEEVVGRVRGVTDDAELAGLDLVVEAVFERVEVKRAVLESLDRILPEHAVIASNTSSLSISRLAHGLTHRAQTLVVHFFNPPSTLPLIEVAGGVDTRDDVVTDVLDFLQGLRNHRYPMVPVRVKEAPAFVVNRLLIPVLNEACFVLDEGIASARDIDLAMKTGAGFPMGPFELADLIGLDIALEVSETLQREYGDPKYRPSVALRRLVDAGHLGRKTGRGFYEYG